MKITKELAEGEVGGLDALSVLKEMQHFVVGQLGQSLDGRIATRTGESKYINQKQGLLHLHRLRALVDAVIVGVGTVNEDNPSLTVRHCDGKSPKRVIIDPKGRVFKDAQLFHDDGPETLILTDENKDHPLANDQEVVGIKVTNERIDPHDILDALAKKGLHRILVEGGSRTLSNFIDRECLDRLHLIVAPLLIGGGYSSLNLSAISKLDKAIKPDVSFYKLGHDVLFDCDLKPKRASN